MTKVGKTSRFDAQWGATARDGFAHAVELAQVRVCLVPLCWEYWLVRWPEVAR
jgi:hypothetical protein